MGEHHITKQASKSCRLCSNTYSASEDLFLFEKLRMVVETTTLV